MICLPSCREHLTKNILGCFVKLYVWYPLKYLYHTNFTRFHSFFDTIIQQKLAPKNIPTLLLFAWFNDYPQAQELLFALLDGNPKAQAEVMKPVFENMSKDEYRPKCIEVFGRYLHSTQPEVIKAYQLKFYRWLPDYFEQVYLTLLAFVQSNVGRYRLNDFYEYLSKCASKHPEKCFELISYFENHQTYSDQKQFHFQKAVQVALMQSYHALKSKNPNSPVLEQALDLFDKMLQNEAYRIKTQEALEAISQ